MSVLTIAIVGGAIATGFYYINRDTATSKKKLKESTAMVFVMSTGVLLLARFLGLGSEDGGGATGKTSGGGGSGGGSEGGGRAYRGGNSLAAARAVPLDYVIGGEPPF